MYEAIEPHDQWGRPVEKATELNCPNCNGVNTVFHFDWHAIICSGCDEEITKEEFLNYKPRKYQLTEEEKDLITLCATEYDASTEERIILGKLMRKLWTK